MCVGGGLSVEGEVCRGGLSVEGEVWGEGLVWRGRCGVRA